MFCTITSLVVLTTETSIDFCDLLMTSQSSSGDFSTSFSSTPETSSVWRNPCSFQPAVRLSQLELICHHFHQLGNTNFSILITRIGFWDSRILPSPLLEQLDHNFACCWHCSFFHGSWGPIPSCFSSFTSIWHVFHQTYYSLLGCFIVASGESSAHPLADSFCLPCSPSPAAIGSLFRASSTRC